MQRPAADEFNEYYTTYTDKVGDRPVLEVLAEAPDRLEALLAEHRPEIAGFAYEDGKWTVAELLGHVIDTERVFSYRALHIARGDSAELPGMDQDEWVAGAAGIKRSVADLLAEFRALRVANVRMFASFDEVALGRRGVASGFEVTPRAIVFIVAGHEIHHRGVLADRYLTTSDD